MISSQNGSFIRKSYFIGRRCRIKTRPVLWMRGIVRRSVWNFLNRTLNSYWAVGILLRITIRWWPITWRLRFIIVCLGRHCRLVISWRRFIRWRLVIRSHSLGCYNNRIISFLRSTRNARFVWIGTLQVTAGTIGRGVNDCDWFVLLLVVLRWNLARIIRRSCVGCGTVRRCPNYRSHRTKRIRNKARRTVRILGCYGRCRRIIVSILNWRIVIIVYVIRGISSIRWVKGIGRVRRRRWIGRIIRTLCGSSSIKTVWRILTIWRGSRI